MEATNKGQRAASSSADMRDSFATPQATRKRTRSEDASVYTAETEGPRYVSEHEIEMCPIVGNTGPTSNQQKPQRSKRRIVWQMGVFYLLAFAFMGVHLGFFLALDGRPVQRSGFFRSQGLQSALANFLAIAVEICLLSGIGVAYDQYLWRVFRQKALRAITIDKLIRLVSSPWNLVVVDTASSAPGPWLIAFVCLLIPIAVVFPPGALTVEFLEGVLPVELNNVPTINLSDWGNGTLPDFTRHALFETGAEMEFRLSVQPKLATIVDLVRGLGEPVQLRNPCDGPCVYSTVFEGPKFNCEERPRPEGLGCAGSIFWAKDEARLKTKPEGLHNNNFSIAWVALGDSPCFFADPARKAIDCSMTLATYNLSVTNFRNGSRDLQTEILSEETIWTSESPIPTYYLRYMPGMDGVIDSPESRANLSAVFRYLQAWAIRRAVTLALNGTLTYYDLDLNPYLEPSREYGSRGALDNPYVGYHDKYKPRVHLTTETLQSYLRDVVISVTTLSPGLSSTKSAHGFTGANVYLFTEPLQFYVPYIACLVVTMLIYVLGYRALHLNGASAGNSFLQFVATTSTSDALHQLGQECSVGGIENTSKDLRNVRLRFGTRSAVDDSGAPTGADVAVFGVHGEVEGFSR
ncbi:hypothetical protein CSOJ01_02390 [Colletotrichum sojae]|uniref:Uncharacterized protein n=1 Tax=Colletotrichum sojae TaxID=2175907 RepID=A0A8H6JR51_9PEZI|nr:hypothetical protein CSOJ01_02390 [Colletotrichum sojae]